MAEEKVKRILISPFARGLRGEASKRENPKNYPYWTELLTMLRDEGFYVIQVGTPNEKQLPADEWKFGLPLKQLEELLESVDVWISVDNFFNHFATTKGRRGIVLWGQSDPNIFGYKSNINLLQGRKYLRHNQYQPWESTHYDKHAFVAPDRVVTAVKSLLSSEAQ